MKRRVTYDAISAAYSDLVDQDPSKKYVQYPWGQLQLPALPCGIRVLDVGCGEGSLARMLARKGAVVFGYDNSITQIEKAHSIQKREPLKIDYVRADPRDIVGMAPSSAFDEALSISVLHYATDLDHLNAFYSSTYQLVKPGGHFAALFFNPDFKRFDEIIYNRRYCREANGLLRVDFFDNRQQRCSAHYLDFKRSDYEAAASANGWTEFEWTAVGIAEEGRERLGDFWAGFEDDCPYAGFRVKKPAA